MGEKKDDRMSDQTTMAELAELLQRVAHIDNTSESVTPSLQMQQQQPHGSGHRFASGGSAQQPLPVPVCGRLTPVNFTDLSAWIRSQTPTTTAAAAVGHPAISPSGFSVSANPNTPLRGSMGHQHYQHGAGGYRADAISPMPGHMSGGYLPPNNLNGGRSGSIPSEYCGSPSGSAHGPSASPPQQHMVEYSSQAQQQFSLPSPARFAVSAGDQSPLRVLTGTPLKQQQQQANPYLSQSGGGTPLGGTSTKFSIEAFRGHVAEAARDQSGCRALQRALDTLPFDSPEVSCIVEEIFPHVAMLMSDPYGNFLIQRLLEVAPDSIRVQLTRIAAQDLPTISTTPHGTFTVQKLIESLRSAEEKEIVCRGLSSNVHLLMTDANGSHVVQKLLQCLGRQDRQFIYDGICASLIEICSDRQGCCIVQKCVEFAFPEQFIQLRHAILQHVLALAVDPYGNYVVANLLDHCNRLQQRHAVDECCMQLSPHLVPLSTNKFSSNVVEKALKYCSEHIAGNIIQQLSQESALREIAFHQFGNYVVQTALVVAPMMLLGPLIRQLQPMLPQLRQINFGRKIEAKVEAGLRRLQHGGTALPQLSQPPPSPNGQQQQHFQQQPRQNNISGNCVPPSPQRHFSHHTGNTRPQQTCTPPPMPPQALT